MARISRTILHSTEAARRAMATLALTVLLALAASEAHAGIAFVQSLGTNASQSSGTSIAVTLTAAVAAGDTVIVTFAMDPATGTVTCADTKGNTYTADADVTNGSGTSGVRTIVFSAPVTTALVSGNTITVTHPTATARALSVNEFSGLATTAAFDKKASATNTVANMTPSSGSTATISQPVELLIGAIGVEGKSSDTFTAGSGYTALSSTGSGQSGSDGTIYITIDPEYRIVSTAQGYTANGTLGTSRLWAAAIATYKAPTCGNGLVDAGEDCDVALGGACCDATCHFLPSSAVCRAAVAGGCDVAETCTGSSDACPADGFQPSGTVCRASAGSCDVAETCSGSTATCPTDAFSPSGTVCRPALNECDNQETCSGTSATCPADTVKSAGTACSDDGHVCTSDVCNGTVGAPACTHPAKASGTACPDDGNVCTRDVCDGTSLDCTHPAGNAGTVCRAAVAGGCDIAETCTGTSTTCPADAVQPAGTVCRAAVAGGCDIAETCNGTSNSCPADVFQPSGTVCRASAGPCDVAETCTGSSATCPTNAFLPSGTVCRPALNECDNQETCSGTSATCPADTVKSAGTACSDDGHVCTSDVCNGTVGAPACTHPAKASGTACPDDGNVCTRDVCDGTSLDCTHPAGNAGTVCRAAAGVCDVAETCTGTSATCPADAFVSSSVVCRAAVAGGCDIAENCPGNGPNCPADVVQPNGTVCRAAAGECDLAETCNGTSNTCPADAKKTSGTACTDDGNACTSDTCDGTSNLCQHPAGNPLGTCLTQTQSAAGTCANATGIGTVAWTNPSRAQTSNDSYATAPFSSNGDASNYLKCTNFGFSVPTNSTIQGIKVEWEYSNTSGGTIQDNASRIVKGGTIGTTDKSTATAWPGTDTFVAYGSSADLWSDSWTPSDINSSGFGAALSASQNSGGSRTASVDSVRITVSYVTCGNGAVDAGEQCDDGAANGTAGSCCAANCTFKTSGTACTDDGNPCTTDTCSGSSNLCQHAPGNAGTVCRAAADVCDVAETCTGSSATCPPDGVRPNTFVCRAGSGDICDPSETCDGTSKSCPADVVASSGTVCRGATGECDLAETCSGVAGQPCPSDAKKASGTACTDDGNPCTLDRCDGSNAACQHPAGNAGAICRASAGVCDPAETCTGTSTTCPADAKSPAGTVCGPSGVCDVAPTCDGTSNSCPAGTATTLGAAPASSKFHTSVTLTATVTKCDSTAVTEGSVSFIDGGTCSSPGTTLAGPTAVNGGGQTSLTTSSLSVGTHTITACYSDTPANFGASSGSATETVSARIRII